MNNNQRNLSEKKTQIGVPVIILSLLVSIYPYSKAIYKIELGVITFDLFLLGMIAMLLPLSLRLLSSSMKYRVTSSDLMMLLLGVIFMISTFRSENIIESGYLAFHAIFIPMMAFFYIKVFIQNRKQYKIFCVITLVGCILLSVISVGVMIYLGERAFVFTTAPIGIATILIVALILLMVGGNTVKTTGKVCALILLLGFLATMSRLYIIALFFVPLLNRYFKKRKAPIIFLLMFLITLIITFLLIVFMDELLPSRIDVENIKGVGRLFDPEIWKYALYGRAQSQEIALETFKEHPLIGNGLFKGETMITEHNLHVEWLLYGGIIGYIIYVLIFMFHVSSVNRHLRKSHSRDSMLVAGLVSLIVVLLNSVTNGFMHGLIPLTTYIVMGLNEARMGMREVEYDKFN